jgi:hypothetical protein
MAYLLKAFGLYSSRCEARWQAWPHILRAAPRGWRLSHMDPVPAQADPTQPTTVPHAACRSAWARLIAKVYEVDLLGGSPCPAGALARREGGREADSESPMLCPRCGSAEPLFNPRIAAEKSFANPTSPLGLASCTMGSGVFQGPAFARDR